MPQEQNVQMNDEIGDPLSKHSVNATRLYNNWTIAVNRA